MYQENTKPETSVISIIALVGEIIPLCQVHSLVEMHELETAHL